eukprot:Opistho-2@74516
MPGGSGESVPGDSSANAGLVDGAVLPPTENASTESSSVAHNRIEELTLESPSRPSTPNNGNGSPRLSGDMTRQRSLTMPAQPKFTVTRPTVRRGDRKSKDDSAIRELSAEGSESADPAGPRSELDKQQSHGDPLLSSSSADQLSATSPNSPSAGNVKNKIASSFGSNFRKFRDSFFAAPKKADGTPPTEEGGLKKSPSQSSGRRGRGRSPSPTPSARPASAVATTEATEATHKEEDSV